MWACVLLHNNMSGKWNLDPFHPFSTLQSVKDQRPFCHLSELCFSTKTNHFDAGGWSLNSSIFQYWPMEVEVDIFNIVVRRVVFVCVFVFDIFNIVVGVRRVGCNISIFQIDIFNIVVGVRRVGCSNTRVGKLAVVKWGRKSNSMPRGDRGKTFREFLIYLAFPQRALAVEMSTERNQ